MPQPGDLLRQLDLDDLVGGDTSRSVTDGARRRQRLPALPHPARGADRRERRAGGGRRRHLHAHLPAQSRCRLERRHADHQHRRVVHLAGPPRHRRHPQHHRLRAHQRHRRQRPAHRCRDLPRALRPLARPLRVRASGARPRPRHQHRRQVERPDPRLGRAVAAAVLEPGPARARAQRQLLGARAAAPGGPGHHGASRGHRLRGGGAADRRGHGGLPPAVPRRRAAPHRRPHLHRRRRHLPGRALDQPERPRPALRGHQERPPGRGLRPGPPTHRRGCPRVHHRGPPGAAVRRLEPHVRRLVRRRLRPLHPEPREGSPNCSPPRAGAAPTPTASG